MTTEEVLKLATLARIELEESEVESLTREFESIITYVSEVQGAVTVSNEEVKNKAEFPIRNILREDDNAHEGGIYTNAILKGAPHTEGEYIRVKKIL